MYSKMFYSKNLSKNFLNNNGKQEFLNNKGKQDVIKNHNWDYYTQSEFVAVTYAKPQIALGVQHVTVYLV